MAVSSGGASGSKGGGKGGSSGSNAALHDDEDLMARRRVTFSAWKAKRKKAKHPSHVIDYANSPSPPR